MVRPLTYRHLRFTKLSAMDALTNHLVRHSSLTGCNLGMFCRSLELQNGDIELTMKMGEAVLTNLLVLLPRLELFYQDIGTVGYSHMFFLASSCKDTLRSLSVALANGQSYATSLLLIGQMRRLQELFVETGPMSDESDAALAGLPPLELGKLTDVGWAATRVTPNWLSYIARSQFPALRRIRLCVAFNDGQTELLRPFFTRHPDIQGACLDVDWSHLGSMLLMPLSVHTLEFSEGVPPADELLPNCPVSVRRLKIVVDDDTDYNSEVFDLLRAFDFGQMPPGLEEIHLSPGFDWTWYKEQEPLEDVAGFYGRVVHHAMRLAVKGILVKDRQGTCLKL
jgi:hypothetical protein